MTTPTTRTDQHSSALVDARADAPATPVHDTDTSTPQVGEGARRHAIALRRRVIACAPPTVVVVALSMVPAWQFTGWQWVAALLSLPVVTWGAWPFHSAAWRAGRHGSTTMDTLVSLGVIASTLWSWWALLFGGAGMLGMRMQMSLLPRAAGHHAEIYFEGACVITLFLLIGRWAEARTRYRAGDALRSLLELGAKEATRLRTEADGTRHEERIPAADLAVGDLFLVRPGEKVATDGRVVEGSSALDTSLLTGESVPVDVSEGDDVTGATVNTWGALVVRATRVGSETTLAQIGRMVTEAQAGKAPVQRLADRISSVFVPVVIAISLVTLAGWLLAGGSVQAAFTAAVAVLVVACPCALGLATPTALLVGSGRASQLGIVIKSAEILEQTRTIDTMVLDKTGTITTGRMSLDSVVLPGGTTWAPDAVPTSAPVGAPVATHEGGAARDGGRAGQASTDTHEG
ncbi:HAD-IC family P-type ATPase, partial [Actinomyces polynesiensis]|uniref:HAD-IC family P-type ATPase n=1 Tax=Actinomyces polynesiensis TaxID=1325934 RepID=UPI0011CB6667